MFKNSVFAISVVSVYLLIYVVLFQTGMPFKVLLLMYLFSPFLVMWMVITVLRDDRHDDGELAEGHEWGYRDKKREDLGTFF